MCAPQRLRQQRITLGKVPSIGGVLATCQTAITVLALPAEIPLLMIVLGVFPEMNHLGTGIGLLRLARATEYSRPTSPQNDAGIST